MARKSFKCRKGIFYFPTFDDARSYAKAHGYPSGLIRSFELGWAIQLRISGPYVGLPTQMYGEAGNG